MKSTLQLCEQRLALARITERYPPDTVAGRLAADALAKYPNQFENADRENDCEPFPIPEIEGLLLGPLLPREGLEDALFDALYDSAGLMGVATRKAAKACVAALEVHARESNRSIFIEPHE